MSTEQGYVQTISTAEFTETPRLVLEQATGDVYIEAWDSQEIEISTREEDEEFEIEVDGSQVIVKGRPSHKAIENWSNFAPELSNFGIDLDKMAARVQRNISRTMRRTGRGFDINIELGRWAGNRDYRIKVPFNCHLSLRTSSGDLRLSDVTGTHLIQTTSGDITMRRMGGNVLLSSASGDIHIDGLEGKLGVKTASGEIEIHNANLQEVSAHTASGDVGLDLLSVPQKDFDVRTVSGDVDIHLPNDAQLTIEANTLSGEIDCDLTHTKTRNGRTRTLVVNGGGTQARIGTVSGDIDIMARRGGSSSTAEPSEKGESATRSEAQSARKQAEMEILQMVERGELSPQDAMRRLADLPR